MKKVIMFAAFVGTIMILTSCSRGISPEEAANGRAKCGRYIR